MNYGKKINKLKKIFLRCFSYLPSHCKRIINSFQLSVEKLVILQLKLHIGLEHHYIGQLFL